jgi:acyl carrier protein
MREDVLKELRNILVDDLLVDLPTEAIGEADGLQTVVGLDSLGFIELRVACENRFGVEVSDAEFTSENFRSLGALADLVVRLKSGSEVVKGAA